MTDENVTDENATETMLADLRTRADRRRGGRWIATTVITGSLVVALVVSAFLSGSDKTPTVDPGSLSSSQADLAQSTAWFCPATSGTADGSITVTNPTGSAIAGTANLAAINGLSATVSINVPANGEAVIKPADLISDGLVAATLQFDSSGAVVAHRFASSTQSANPCVEGASDQWTFVEASTQGNAAVLVSLYNPFPDEAVVKVSFATNTGPATPSNFEGVVVPPRSVVAVDVAAALKRRDWVVPVVQIRRGRIAAEVVQTPDSSRSKAVLARSVTGAPEPSARWHLDESAVTDASSDQISIYNPGAVEIGVTLDAFAGDGTAIDPFTLRIPALSRIAVDLRTEARIPRNVGISADVIGDGGAPIVVARATGFGPDATPGTADFRLGARK